MRFKQFLPRIFLNGHHSSFMEVFTEPSLSEVSQSDSESPLSSPNQGGDEVDVSCSSRSGTPIYSRFRKSLRHYSGSSTPKREKDRVLWLRRDIAKLRSCFVSEFQQFRGCLTDAKYKAKSAVLAWSKSVAPPSGDASLDVEELACAREREERVASLEQQVSMLTERLEEQKSVVASNVALRNELEERQRQIREMEAQAQREIGELKRKVEEQAGTIKEYQEKRFNVVQLQEEVRQKSQEIRELTAAKADLTEKLVHQTAECVGTADDLKFACSAMSGLEANGQALEKENTQLKRTIQTMEERLERASEVPVSLTMKNEELRSENERLKSKEEEKEKKLEELMARIATLERENKEKEHSIEEKLNEISVLRMENSISRATQNVAESVKVVQEQPCEKVSNKIQRENSELKLRLQQKEQDMKGLESVIESMRASVHVAEKAKEVAEDKLIRSEAICDKRNEVISGLKSEIRDLKGRIQEKDEFITQAISIQEERSQEMKRLQASLEAISTLTLSVVPEHMLSDDFLSEFTNVSEALSQSRQEVNSLNTLTEKQSEEIRVLTSAAEDTNAELQSAEHRIAMLTEENCNLRAQNRTLEFQTSGALRSTGTKLDDLQSVCQRLTQEHIEHMQQISELTQQLAEKEKKLQNIGKENAELQEENSLAAHRYNTEVVPLREEIKRLNDANERLRQSIEFMTASREQLVNHSDEVTHALLHKKKEKILRLKGQLLSCESDLKSANEFTVQAMNALAASSPASALKAIERMKREVEDVKERLVQQKMQMSSPNIITSQVVYERDEGQSVEGEEEKATQVLLDSIQRIIKFDTFDDLIKHIEQLVSSSEEKDREIEKLEAQILENKSGSKAAETSLEKLTYENKGQAKMIDLLNGEVAEVREMASDQRLSMIQVIQELRDKVTSLEGRNDELETEFNRFHSIINFAHVSELFLAVSNLLIEKRREISELTFRLQKVEDESAHEIDGLTRKLRKLSKQAEVTQDIARENADLKLQISKLEQKVLVGKSDNDTAIGAAVGLKSGLRGSRIDENLERTVEKHDSQIEQQNKELLEENKLLRARNAVLAKQNETVFEQCRVETETSAQLTAKIDTLSAELNVANEQNRELLSKLEHEAELKENSLMELNELSLDHSEIATEVKLLRQQAEDQALHISSLVLENESLKQIRGGADSDASEEKERELLRLKEENEGLKEQILKMKNAENLSSNEVSEMDSDISRLKSENARLKSANSGLAAKNRSLKTKNSSSQIQEQQMRGTNRVLHSQNTQLISRNTSLEVENTRFKMQIKDLQEENIRLQDKVEAQLATIESFKLRLEKSRNELEAEKTKCHAEKANGTQISKQNRSLTLENTRISRENREMKNQLSEYDVKIMSLEETVQSLTSQTNSLQQVIDELEARNKTQSDTIAEMKRSTRMARRKATDLNSVQQILVEQADQLSLLQQQTSANTQWQERVKVLMNENARMQKAMTEPLKQTDESHFDTGTIMKQCIQIIHHVSEVVPGVKIQRVQFPLTKAEIVAINSGLNELKDKCCQQSVYLDKVLMQAKSRGFTGKNVETALEFLLGKEGEKEEVDDLRQKINAITTTSDRRKKTAKEYLEKLRDKLKTSTATIETLRQVKEELIHVNRGEEYDASFLRKNLTNEEAMSIGLV